MSRELHLIYHQNTANSTVGPFTHHLRRKTVASRVFEPHNDAKMMGSDSREPVRYDRSLMLITIKGGTRSEEKEKKKGRILRRLGSNPGADPRASKIEKGRTGLLVFGKDPYPLEVGDGKMLVQGCDGSWILASRRPLGFGRRPWTVEGTN